LRPIYESIFWPTIPIYNEIKRKETTLKSFKEYLKEYASVTDESLEPSKEQNTEATAKPTSGFGSERIKSLAQKPLAQKPLAQKPLNIATPAVRTAATSARKPIGVLDVVTRGPYAAIAKLAYRGSQKVGEYIGKSSVGSPEDVVSNEIEFKKAVNRDNPDLKARQEWERQQRAANRQQDEQEQRGKI